MENCARIAHPPDVLPCSLASFEVAAQWESPPRFARRESKVQVHP